MKVLVTGGAGFVGSYVTEHMVAQGHTVCVADRFTYAGKGKNLQGVLDKITLLIGDLSTGDLAQRCAAWEPEYVVHLAAETHVDRAIADPQCFMVSNGLGTCNLLDAFAKNLSTGLQKLVVYSTDEVYGPTPRGERFTESAPFTPSNAYSASKVAVEGLASAFFVTHGLPIVVVRPCNTYGPRQHPEKVIPKFVNQLLRRKPMTVYNDGAGTRDWLYATDHARAIETLLMSGVPGEAYNLAAENEQSDLEIAKGVAALVAPHVSWPMESLNAWISYQPGRPGHDRRYAMDGGKLRALGWQPEVLMHEGFAATVTWNIMEQLQHWASDALMIG